jgi:hypothetical protein
MEDHVQFCRPLGHGGGEIERFLEGV